MRLRPGFTGVVGIGLFVAVLLSGAAGAGAAVAGAATIAAVAGPALASYTGASASVTQTHPDVAGDPDSFGSAVAHGNAPANLVRPVVGIASTSDGGGYWMVATDGGVFAFGDAGYHGSMGGRPLNEPIVGIAAATGTPSLADEGYWLVASDGGVFSFGGAGFYGSMGGRHLNEPIVGIASTSDGKGYWLVASDGGVFAFGDARFEGSMGGRHLNAPVVGIATSAPGGYWLVASDGGIFAFGRAPFRGSMGGRHLVSPVVGIATVSDFARPAVASRSSGPSYGPGYWMVAADGGVFSFDEPFWGSMGGATLADPVTGIAAIPSGSGYWLLPTNPAATPISSPPPPSCNIAYVCGHVTAIGDSVMLDVQPDLMSDIPGIDVEAAVSRQWDEGVSLAQQMLADHTLGSIVVIDLGTNGPVTPAQFQQMMSVLSGASVVVFVTVHLPPSYSWWQSVNQTLEQGVPMYSNTKIADFNALADQNPGWFGSDGVHMPIGGAGAQAMAALIASTI